MGLQEYNRRRHFQDTPEPRGDTARGRAGLAGFVVQLHHARARHYDFRLEVDGVLRSWAVPRGPSFRPGERRLAVEVEDHPMSYAGFSGTIPEGNYGAGHVALFDTGHWAPEGDPAEALSRGRLDFELFGGRLRGRWTLVRTRKAAGKPQWMLLKRTDEHAADLEADDLLGDIPPPPQDAPGASTAKGRRILANKAAGDADSTTTASRAAPAKRPRARAQPEDRSEDPMPRLSTFSAGELRRRARTLAGRRRIATGEFVPPMLTISSHAAPEGDDWIHEWKWDGYRLMAQTGRTTRLWSRNGIDWTPRVPELVEAMRTLPVAALMDGELIAVDARGYSDFNGLQRALKADDTSQLRFAAFDLLAIDGIDLTRAPLLERKALLEVVLKGRDPRLFYSGHVEGHGGKVFAAAKRQGMEGIISKRSDAPYTSGRSDAWRKVKAVETRDFVVVGYTMPKGSRQGIGALLLARRVRGRLVYAGRVGSGLDARLLEELPRRLAPLRTDQAAVDLPDHTPLAERHVTWVRPELVVEVIFRGWGKEQLLRQASFHRLRDDKPAGQDTDADQPVTAAVSARGIRKAASAKSASKKTVLKTAEEKAVARKAVARKATSKKTSTAGASPDLPTLSSPDRVVYPDAGFTKRDVFEYYLGVADRLLPELRGRLLSIVRCPDGIGGQHFFQKHAGPGFGASVRSHELVENDGDHGTYFHVDDLPGLMSLVQMNALELHVWGSRVEALERPDRIVFDLDPDTAVGWGEIKRAAVDVRDRLDEVGLASYPRLTGGKGVHVVVPLRAEAEWGTVRDFCSAFAHAMATQEPDRFTATMSKAKREGRIFLDWLRNGRGATAIASWSLRARPGAPVAVPLTWAELSRIRKAARFTLKDAVKREVPDEVAALELKPSQLRL